MHRIIFLAAFAVSTAAFAADDWSVVVQLRNGQSQTISGLSEDDCWAAQVNAGYFDQQRQAIQVCERDVRRGFRTESCPERAPIGPSDVMTATCHR